MKEIIEKRELIYHGEVYYVDTTYYTDESGERWTTTESDQRWWEDLRSQYITRHPEILKKYIQNFPKPNLEKITPKLWKATDKDGICREGTTKEEAIKNLYICLGN